MLGVVQCERYGVADGGRDRGRFCGGRGGGAVKRGAGRVSGVKVSAAGLRELGRLVGVSRRR